MYCCCHQQHRLQRESWCWIRCCVFNMVFCCHQHHHCLQREKPVCWLGHQDNLLLLPQSAITWCLSSVMSPLIIILLIIIDIILVIILIIIIRESRDWCWDIKMICCCRHNPLLLDVPHHPPPHHHHNPPHHHPHPHHNLTLASWTRSPPVVSSKSSLCLPSKAVTFEIWFKFNQF